MKLTDTNQYIKDNLENLIKETFSNKFTKEELHLILEISFLLNHIEFENPDTILFNYDNFKIRISNIHEMTVTGLNLEDSIIHTIKSQVEFNNCFKSFLRDININKILHE